MDYTKRTIFSGKGQVFFRAKQEAEDSSYQMREILLCLRRMDGSYYDVHEEENGITLVWGIGTTVLNLIPSFNLQIFLYFRSYGTVYKWTHFAFVITYLVLPIIDLIFTIWWHYLWIDKKWTGTWFLLALSYNFLSFAWNTVCPIKNLDFYICMSTIKVKVFYCTPCLVIYYLE